jgi:DNA invertase Pin-like site-specific DNA recombinase
LHFRFLYIDYFHEKPIKINGGVIMARISKVELIKLQKALKTDERIAKKYGITRQAVQLMRKRYGIESRLAKNPERNKKIRAMYKAGKTGIEIAKKLGLSMSQTYRMIRK